MIFFASAGVAKVRFCANAAPRATDETPSARRESITLSLDSTSSFFVEAWTRVARTLRRSTRLGAAARGVARML